MRAIVGFLFTLLLVVVVAWLGFWWYLQGRLQSGIENWAEKQTAHGVIIAYSSLQRGTNPMVAQVSLTNLTVTLPQEPNGAQPVVTFPTLALRMNMTSLTTLHADLPGKISVSAGGNFDVVMNSGSIGLTEYLDPAALNNKSAYPFKGGDFFANDVDFLASSGSLLVLHMDSLTGHADINVSATGAQTALNETLDMTGMSLSPLMTKIASIPFDGKINEFDFSLKLSGPVPPQIYTIEDQLRADAKDEVAQQKLVVPIIHQWASQGGNGSLGMKLAIGPSTASADGAVKFDANIQPEGTGNLTADHLDQFTSALTAAYPQVANMIAAAEAQLTPYISNDPQTGQTLTMHATYGAGAVNVNGTKVGPLPPVDWNTLENPPPAPPPVPMDTPPDASQATPPDAPPSPSGQ